MRGFAFPPQLAPASYPGASQPCLCAMMITVAASVALAETRRKTWCLATARSTHDCDLF